MATSSKTKVSLKLLIDTNGKRVLYAEAGKDFVDFLFNLLRLPVGAVVEVLKKQTMVGTLGNLYESIENLNETYFQPNTSKQSLLNPKAPIGFGQCSGCSQKVYACNNSDDDEYNQYHPYVSNDPEALCPDCNLGMWREAVYVAREEGEEAELAAGDGGFVKGVVAHMVMDDLVVTPMVVDMGMPEVPDPFLFGFLGLEAVESKFAVEDGFNKLLPRKIFMSKVGSHDYICSSGLEVMHAKCFSLYLQKEKPIKLLFAEAGKDFVDFLFTLLSLPIGTVVRLLTAKSMVGSLGNLYDSVDNLSDTYMQPNLSKEVLLKPKVAVRSTEASLLLTNDDAPAPAVNKMYKCGNCARYVTNDPRVICPSCKYNYTMSTEVTFVPPKVADTGLSGEGGYVKGVLTYMVMDDLVVIPMSTISGIALLSKFNVTNVQSLEEKVVTIGMDEGLKLLKATLHSKMVLTSVFLGGMKTMDASSSIPSDPVTVGETGPTTDASASTSKAMSEPPPNEAVASSEPKSKEFHERVEECFNITFCGQDNIIKELAEQKKNIIKEQKRIRRRVDYFVAKLEEQFGATYFSEGEEEDANYVPHDINIIT
ncbi:hypothetical protein RHSIM_Rhsim09G0159300 [Rhododendron simsii]|uniref:DUF674 domain-containing protein n=1 Tax=Rhododendron simsii TaxID=118357 RepID=A0A834GFY6_RHOSS|nr:hypothetical protein RHSIM_Rhsim09G0159300 [Rhododendron simsii]